MTKTLDNPLPVSPYAQEKARQFLDSTDIGEYNDKQFLFIRSALLEGIHAWYPGHIEKLEQQGEPHPEKEALVDRFFEELCIEGSEVRNRALERLRQPIRGFNQDFVNDNDR